MDYYKPSKSYIFVFDIETIPDYKSAYNLLGLNTNTPFTNSQLNQKLKDYHLEITDGKNDFLRQPFHKVVAISYLYAQVDIHNKHEHYMLKDLRSAGTLPYNTESEKELVAGFFEMINKYNSPKLVSFNGRMFDLPVLKYRAMQYGISGGSYYKAENNFKSYDYKFNTEKHCDLIDALSDFGASAKIKLNEVCAVLGLPGKFGVDGSNVLEMFENNKVQEIRDYCETDVLNTYLLYLKYALHTNRLNVQNYNFALQDVLQLIESKNTNTLNSFKQQWQQAHYNTYGNPANPNNPFAPFIPEDFKK